MSTLLRLVVNGLDSTLGSIAGAIFLTLLGQVLQAQPHLADALYGAIVMVFLLFLPGGLAGLLAYARGHRMAVAPVAEGSNG